jgi:hypothetical protein
MPIHLDDRDVISEVQGLRSALIVPCNICPAVTVAVRENEPFIQLFRYFLKSAPFEKYIREMQSRLGEKGVRTDVFRSDLPHQWFLCMWTSGQRKKLKEQVKHYDAVIALGCDSATATVRSLVDSTECRVIEGMEVAGIMNATIRFRFPGTITFDNCDVVPISRRNEGTDKPGRHRTEPLEEMPTGAAQIC